MRGLLRRIGWVTTLLVSMVAGGINWKAVWLEPRTLLILKIGESQPYTVMGLNGADVKANLTKSPDLTITSSDTSVLEIDAEHRTFIGKKPGHANIVLSFSEATEMVPAFVRASKTSAASDVDGVWDAVFTGDRQERPKMISDIAFALDSSVDALAGTVHAARWPGDGAVADGKIEGERISFTMTGHLPFKANGITGYPKLCFTGVPNAGGMRIELRWTAAGNSCDSGKVYPMIARKLGD
ncbi:MAG TPA: hypothetical protein VG675_06235 [Bryobacteraceae bacterium]|nr:hypothetical protein [Bryobacteraceae bacterium]